MDNFFFFFFQRRCVRFHWSYTLKHLQQKQRWWHFPLKTQNTGNTLTIEQSISSYEYVMKECTFSILVGYYAQLFCFSEMFHSSYTLQHLQQKQRWWHFSLKRCRKTWETPYTVYSRVWWYGKNALFKFLYAIMHNYSVFPRCFIQATP